MCPQTFLDALFMLPLQLRVCLWALTAVTSTNDHDFTEPSSTWLWCHKEPPLNKRMDEMGSSWWGKTPWHRPFSFGLKMEWHQGINTEQIPALKTNLCDGGGDKIVLASCAEFLVRNQALSPPNPCKLFMALHLTLCHAFLSQNSAFEQNKLHLLLFPRDLWIPAGF